MYLLLRQHWLPFTPISVCTTRCVCVCVRVCILHRVMLDCTWKVVFELLVTTTLSLSHTHTHTQFHAHPHQHKCGTHTHTHARMHSRTRARTHARTVANNLHIYIYLKPYDMWRVVIFFFKKNQNNSNTPNTLLLSTQSRSSNLLEQFYRSFLWVKSPSVVREMTHLRVPRSRLSCSNGIVSRVGFRHSPWLFNFFYCCIHLHFWIFCFVIWYFHPWGGGRDGGLFLQNC